jgi:hypothetical protein
MMSTNDEPEQYERPAIDERAAVGDPLIQCYASPNWRRGDDPSKPEKGPRPNG